MADTEIQPSELVRFTETAKKMALRFLAEEEEPSDKVVRLGVTSGGCSGFTYAVSIDIKKEDDHVQAYDGFEAVVDPVSAQFLKGATLDYVDEIGQAGFKFDNPHGVFDGEFEKG